MATNIPTTEQQLEFDLLREVEKNKTLESDYQIELEKIALRATEKMEWKTKLQLILALTPASRHEKILWALGYDTEQIP